MRSRLGYCQGCSSTAQPIPAIYKCPGCGFVSCSAKCVQQHKNVNKCTGVRNRAAIVQKRNYTEDNLMSDYALLEDTGRIVDVADRTLDQISRGKGPAPHLMKRLMQEAAKRSIRLRFMPPAFARHKRNTTQIKSAPKPRASACGLKGIQMLFWHIDVYFAGTTSSSNQLVKVESCPEDVTIEAIASGALSVLRKKSKRRKIDANSFESYTVSLYESVQLKSIAVFLQNEHVVSTNASENTKYYGPSPDGDLHRYVALEQSQTLLQALRGRAVIEFPVLHIAIKGSAESDRLSRSTFELFEKPEPESSSSSDSSDSDSDSDQEEAAESGACNPSGATSQCHEHSTNGSIMDVGKTDESTDVENVGTSKSENNSSTLSVNGSSPDSEDRRQSAAPDGQDALSIKEVGNLSYSIVAESGPSKKQVATDEVAQQSGQDIPGLPEKRASKPSQWKSLSHLSTCSAPTTALAETQTPKINGISNGKPGIVSRESFVKGEMQSDGNGKGKDNDIQKGLDVEKSNHSPLLFDLPLPKGRVPRKPKTAVV